MAENKEEVVEQVEETKVENTKVEETKAEEPKKDTGFQEDGTYKVNLDQPVVDEKATEEKVEEPVEETKEETESPVLQEVTEEQEDNQPEPTQEVVEEVEEKIEDKTPEMELPENIQKVVDFMNETGGTLEDYVRLNADYSNVDNEALLREYYKSTKPHLTSEEVNFMLEDNFSYDEEVDESRDIKRKKLAYKEAVAQAKNHLEGLKSKYYQEVKLGSRLAPEQQKAIDFFNRYNKEQVEVQELNAKQQKHFNQETDKVFNENFKGFDFQVGDKKYRYNVKDAQQTRKAQDDVFNAFSSYVSKENLLSDAKGYHKALFAARNADAIANHFYEQGRADAVKRITSEAKNINLTRKTADGNIKVSDKKMRVISGDNSSSEKFKLKNY